MTALATPPPANAGFRPADLTDPYLCHVGPFYLKDEDDGSLTVAIHAMGHHINQYGRVHGGMLATLADVAIGFNINNARPETHITYTLNLNTDFIGAANIGDWIEAHVEMSKKHGRIQFGSCHIRVGEKPIVSAQAVFMSPNQ